MEGLDCAGSKRVLAAREIVALDDARGYAEPVGCGGPLGGSAPPSARGSRAVSPCWTTTRSRYSGPKLAPERRCHPGTCPAMPSRCRTCMVARHTLIRSRSPSLSGTRAMTEDTRCRVLVRGQGDPSVSMSNEGVLGKSWCILWCCGDQGCPCARRQALVEGRTQQHFSLCASSESEGRVTTLGCE